MARRLAALAGIACGLAVLGGPVAAQTAAMRSALDTARDEARQLRGMLLVQAQDPTRVAAIEIRLSRLEEELRRMTGRLEELEFKDRATQARLDELVADLDARLIALGSPRSSAAPAPAVAPAPPLAGITAPPGDPVALPTPRSTASTPAEDLGARQDNVLGTLSEESVDRSTADAGSVARAVPSTPKGRYDAALARLQRGDFPGARDDFASFVSTYPSDALAPSAAYWLAETHYVEGDLDTAAALFARNYQTYGTDAPKAPDNLLKMGLALAQIGKREQACQTYAELDRRHPNAPAPVKQAVIRGKVGAACSG